MNEGERAALRGWLGSPPRHPQQTHGVHESDAEVVRLGEGSWLAASVDALEQEIADGLYADPYTIGWVAATNGLSDLAAVGAEPVGLLLAACFGPDWPPERRARLAEGLSDCLRASETALLGGDTGGATTTVVTTTGIGRVEGAAPLSRVGASVGDVVCVTGATGSGAALAARFLLGDEPSEWPEERFRPLARLGVGAAVRGVASTCTDSSDGLIQAVELLASLNGLGAALEWEAASLDPAAAAYLSRRGVPLWLGWLSEAADYELVMSVPESRLSDARRAAGSVGLWPIGRLVEGSGVTLSAGGGPAVPIDVGLLGAIAAAPPSERLGLLAELISTSRAQGLP
jgi:thiamine-monophosphate kinase